ncbi:polysaccharide deacetylase family protein [Sphaerisporangium sp. TRM90804]|uniref:polysaccharide deacetylase family protein n=1 Tax=Sphaerisporangium sp. TRM90804 TaxID=3031113 RepID=UPI002448088D|nr:polysaccharide deacetylase family protein [Sphaerisporangium sp. TRM90804]MDH2423868.1 polysaccharide deacetylase family protein [Sphaerisporangium sp. TRM90804]
MRRWIPVLVLATVSLTAAPVASADTAGTRHTSSTNTEAASAPAGRATAGETGARGTAAKKVNCAKVKCIALTFDDGPGAYTGKLLDTLRKAKVKVSFFLVGTRVERYPALARRIAREGHEVGNHSYDHPYLTSLLDDHIYDELSRTQDVIREATGKRPGIMRPPYGDTDERVAAAAAELGLSQILWNGSSRDWELRDVKAITKKVVGLARRDRVILMHDVWPETVKAMPGILKTLKKKGYHVVPATALLRGKSLPAGEIFPLGGWR